jgi:2-hydroxychromene-2-carboxylate isomerase
MADPGLAAPEQPIFYYDLGTPDCYLVAEQVMAALPVVPEWQPVLAVEPAAIDCRRVEQRAAELGLQPIRWPERLPPESGLAMLAATYAKQIGRGVAFSLAAFRQAFAAGRDLNSQETVLITGAACEMHPTALLKALERHALSHALDAATAAARTRGVGRLPAIEAGNQVLAGPNVLDQAREIISQMLSEVQA